MSDVLEKLWDIEQIKQLRHRAARLFDTRDYAAYEDLFTPDVVMKIVGQGEPYSIEGRAALMETARSMPPGTTVHHVHMPEIELIDASHARGTWALMDYVDLPGHRSFIGYGHYHDEYVKGEDGRWRFARYEITRLRVDELEPPS